MSTGKRIDPAATADSLHSAAIHLLRKLRRIDAGSGLNAPRLSALSVIVFAGPLTLGQLANAATSPGGLASTTNSTAAPPASGGLLGGLFGSVIGALTGGGSAAAGSESAEILAGLNTFTSMLHSGVQVPPAHQQALEDIMGPSNPAPQN